MTVLPGDAPEATIGGWPCSRGSPPPAPRFAAPAHPHLPLVVCGRQGMKGRGCWAAGTSHSSLWLQPG